MSLRRSRRTALVPVLVLLSTVLVVTAGSASAGAAAGGGASPSPSAAAESPNGRFVVRLDPRAGTAALSEVPAAVARSGGTVVAAQRALGTLVVAVHADGARELAAVPGVLDVSPDRELRATSLGFSPTSQPGAMTNVTRLTGAASLWRNGWTGAGVDVALLDSGVAPVGALSNATKVVVGPDLSFESQDPDLRYLDTYGHGTHMAGIIAGREVAKGTGATYAADAGNFYGMAPDARIVSLKLADHDGAVDVSQVIAAIDWVVQHRFTSGLNIRVLNLSYGTLSGQDAQRDPLSWAAEVAWKRGIVVVASAGNDGETRTGLADPAYNPWVLAVGAADTKGTDTTADDVVPAFSARQAAGWGTRGIDVVAPGVGVVSPGVPGSNLFEGHPGARLGNGFLRGSGTSQAAAVVSGGVALLLQQRPHLQPDEVKDLLMVNARKLTAQPVAAQGSGEIDLAAASAAPVLPQMRQRQGGNGTGSLDTARGGMYVAMDGIDLRGERDIMGSTWNGFALASQAASASAWGADGSFNGALWAGSGFTSDTTTWAGRTWSGKTWSGKTWSGKTWSGKTWSGKTWSNATWNGKGWTAAAWASPVAPSGLAGARWSTRSWR